MDGTTDVSDLRSRAVAAAAEQNWDEAIASWEGVLADGVSGLAEALLSSGNVTRAAAVLDKGIEELGRLELFERAGEIAYSAKDWGRSIQLHSEAIRRFGDKVKWTTYRRLSGSLDQAKSQDPASVWSLTWPDLLRDGESLFQRTLKIDDGQDLERDFEKIIGKLGPTLLSADVWVEAFKRLLHFVNNNEEFDRDRLGFAPFREGCTKLIVSGMGWSGSGAIYDFFQEFSGVTAVSRELRHIEGKPSLLTLAKLTGDRDLFARELCRFFFLCLFGYAGYRNISEYQMEYEARSLGRNRKDYARAALSFLTRLTSERFSPDLFKLAAMEFVDKLAMAAHWKPTPVMLLDNMVHLYNIQAVDTISNIRLICSFRDPRSNWAAIVRENVSHVVSVHDFIGQYRLKRSQFDDSFAKLNRRDLVEIVPFEMFVLDRDYRLQLATRCGLDCSNHAEYSRFKPWISARNTTLYREHEPKGEIELIEKELGEYCVEISRAQFLAGSMNFESGPNR